MSASRETSAASVSIEVSPASYHTRNDSTDSRMQQQLRRSIVSCSQRWQQPEEFCSARIAYEWCDIRSGLGLFYDTAVHFRPDRCCDQ